jgi:hypothetical protein
LVSGLCEEFDSGVGAILKSGDGAVIQNPTPRERVEVLFVSAQCDDAMQLAFLTSRYSHYDTLLLRYEGEFVLQPLILQSSQAISGVIAGLRRHLLVDRNSSAGRMVYEAEAKARDSGS